MSKILSSATLYSDSIVYVYEGDLPLWEKFQTSARTEAELERLRDELIGKVGFLRVHPDCTRFVVDNVIGMWHVEVCPFPYQLSAV